MDVTLVVDWCPPFPLSREQLEALDAVRPDEPSLHFEPAEDPDAEVGAPADVRADLPDAAVLRVVLEVDLTDLADAEAAGHALAEEVEAAVGVDGRVVAIAAVGEDAQRSWQYP